MALLAGCASQGVATSPPHTPASLTPSVPAWIRTGVNACGNPYLINATTKRGTIPLVACPGWAGLTPTPTVTVRVGDEVLISGVPKRARLSKRPENLTGTRGSTYVAVRPGRTVVTIHNYLCRPTHTGQPRSCPLVAILAV